jgi:hypothetical protein
LHPFLTCSSAVVVLLVRQCSGGVNSSPTAAAPSSFIRVKTFDAISLRHQGLMRARRAKRTLGTSVMWRYGVSRAIKTRPRSLRRECAGSTCLTGRSSCIFCRRGVERGVGWQPVRPCAKALGAYSACGRGWRLGEGGRRTRQTRASSFLLRIVSFFTRQTRCLSRKRLPLTCKYLAGINIIMQLSSSINRKRVMLSE